ncbi:MAG: DUF3096 domain-containing protein [Chromatiales bacterium]|nr:DUF3096 domain-containing protein [Chromatiales bacterium]
MLLPQPLPLLPRETTHREPFTRAQPLVALLAGILILVVPRLLSTIVAVYLIIVGLIGLLGAGGFQL